jgi:hypothetical protein
MLIIQTCFQHEVLKKLKASDGHQGCATHVLYKKAVIFLSISVCICPACSPVPVIVQ